MGANLQVRMRAFFRGLITKAEFEIFSLETLCHTKRHDNYIFTHPPTHLKRQMDVLLDKMGMYVAP